MGEPDFKELARKKGFIPDASLDDYATLDDTEVRKRLLRTGAASPEQLKQLNEEFDASLSGHATIHEAPSKPSAPTSLIDLARERGYLSNEAYERVKTTPPEHAARALMEQGGLGPEQMEPLLDAFSKVGAPALSCPVCGQPMSTYGSAGSISYSCGRCGTRVDRRREGAVVESLERAPEAVRAAAENKKHHFGSYILVDELGKGGMGVVWRAWDTRLNRWTAMKFLRSDDEADLDRFVGEARTCAGINHPNVVSVFEAGQIDGRHFIAMQRVEGEALNRLRLEPREAVEALRQAALGVHAANEQGIVHRDLKPHNMMVSKTKHVYVMDFGLARSTKSPSHLSVSGSIVGTPSFMAPEQALGGRGVDARTDVYGLGATLFYALVGTAPFEAKSLAELLQAVAMQEPPSPRQKNPKIDRDLDTIVLKCLEKRQDGRYGSVADLAADLERWLKGEPIHARPLLPGVRLWRKLRRNKVAMAIAAVAVVGMSVGGVVGWREYGKAQAKIAEERRKTEEANELTRQAEKARQLRQDANTEFEKAHRQILDVKDALRRGERRRVAPLMEEIAEQQRRAEEIDPTFTEGHVEIARFHRLMGDHDRARRILEGVAGGTALLELGMIKAWDYGAEREVAARAWMEREMDLVRRRQIDAPRPFDEDDLRALHPPLQRLWEEAKALLQQARDELVGRRASQEIECGVARLEFYSGDPQAAMDLLDGNDTPDALLILAEIAEAGRDYEKARHLYEQTLDEFKGMKEPYLALGRMLYFQVHTEWGQDNARAEAAIQAALDHWTKAPDWVREANTSTADMHRLHGDFLLEQTDESPEAAYLAAIAAIPPGTTAPELMGRIYHGRARHRIGLGREPATVPGLLDAAREQFGGEPARLGEVWLTQAKWEGTRGVDPRDSFAFALAAFAEASGDPLTYVRIGEAHSDLGSWLLDHGHDPSPEYDRAIEALRLAPDDWATLQQLGRLETRRAEWEIARGRAPDFAAARAYLDRSIGLRADEPSLYADRGLTASLQAGWDARHGTAPAPAYADFEESLTRKEDADTRVLLGEARLIAAAWAESSGDDPTKFHEAAINEFEVAAHLARAQVGIGRAAERMGTWRASLGEDPSEDWKCAADALARATAANPTDARSFLLQGAAKRQAGDLRARQYVDPTPLYDEARALLDRAFELNRNLWTARVEACAVEVARAAWQADHGVDPTPTLESARPLLDGLPPHPEIARTAERVARQRAEWMISRGLDATAALAEAGDDPAVHLLRAIAGVGDIDAALRETRGPDPGGAKLVQGRAHLLRGDRSAARGEDPVESYESAAALFEAALGINRFLDEARSLGGAARLRIARWNLAYGKPVESVETIAVGSPRDAAAWRTRAAAQTLQAELEEATGTDPKASLAAALASVQESLRIDPEHPEAFLLRAQALGRRGAFELMRGRDAAADLDAAAVDYEKAIQRHARLPAAHQGIARVHHVRALDAWERGVDPTAFAYAAVRSIKLAKAIDAADVDSHIADLEALELAARYLLGTGGGDDDLGAIFAKAVDVIQRGKDVSGLDPRLKAVEARVMELRGEWHDVLGEIADADEAAADAAYKAALDGNPRDVISWTRYGLLLWPDARADEAFDAARRLNAADPRARTMQGVAALYDAYAEFRDGRPTADALGAAQAHFEAALEAHPTLADAWTGLGVAHFRRALYASATDPAAYAEALRCHRRALEINPRHLAAQLELADTLLTAGEEQTAVDAYMRATKINPRDVGAQRQLAYALFKLEAYDQAIEELERLANRHPGHELELGRMCLSYASKRLEAKIDPLAMYDRALGYLLKADAFAELGVARSGRGDWFNLKKQWKEEAAEFRRAAKDYADAGDAKGQAWSLLRQGLALKELGEEPAALYEQAVPLAREGARLAPDEADARYVLAAALTVTEEYDEARDEAERAVTLDPNHAGARDLLEKLREPE